MAALNFAACRDAILAFEGGFTLNRADPGNWTGGKVGVGELKGTNFGIAASAHPNLDIRGMTRESAGLIYKGDYWDKVSGDNLPLGVDLAVFDPAVNSGPGRAMAWLKQARQNAGSDPIHIIDAICSARLSFLHALTTWKAFGKGWGARVASVEAKSHRMALGSTPEASQAIAKAATTHKVKAVKAKTKAKVSVTAGPAAGAVTTAGGGHTALIVVLVLAGIAAAGILAFIAWRESQRAAALSKEAHA